MNTSLATTTSLSTAQKIGLLISISALVAAGSGLAFGLLSKGKKPSPASTNTTASSITSGSTWYVDGSCTNSGNGTTTTCGPTGGSGPFKTIQAAASNTNLNPGDTVIVRDGAYKIANCTQTVLVSIGRGGNSTSMVTFKSENKWGAILLGPTLAECPVNTAGEEFIAFKFANTAPSYVRIEGFDINGWRSVGIGANLGGDYSVFVGNHIHHSGRFCTDTPLGRDGIFLGADRTGIVVEQNLIHDIGRYLDGEYGCSTTHLDHDHGIYLKSNNTIIRNNIFYGVTNEDGTVTNHGWGIHIYGAPEPGPINGVIVNNTFAHGSLTQPGLITFGPPGSSNFRVENNIFYQPKTAAIKIGDTDQTNLVIRNNLTTIGKMTSQLSFSDNILNTDPAFISPGTFNFRLQSTSPAINTGLTLAEVTNDYDGNVRPQGPAYDIGAYEFLADGGGGLPCGSDQGLPPCPQETQ